MTLPAEIRERVRHRANFACEFCGVTEIDAAGSLTIDHYYPRSQGKDDSVDNLIYCCPRCNQYKADYWPQSSHEPHLWNPRHEAAAIHFAELPDGTLSPLTSKGAFTLQRLRLNRPQLIAYRLRKRGSMEQQRLLTRYRELLILQDRVSVQQEMLLEEYRELLEEQRRVLRLLLHPQQE